MTKSCINIIITNLSEHQQSTPRAPHVQFHAYARALSSNAVPFLPQYAFRPRDCLHAMLYQLFADSSADYADRNFSGDLRRRPRRWDAVSVGFVTACGFGRSRTKNGPVPLRPRYSRCTRSLTLVAKNRKKNTKSSRIRFFLKDEWIFLHS